MSSAHRLLLPLGLLMACDPAVVKTGPDDEGSDDVVTDEGLPDSGGETNDGSDAPGGEDAGSDGGGSDPGLTLQSGTWVVSSVEVLDDACDWDFVLSNYYGVSLFGLLPSSFDVDAEAGAFAIEAIDYGASGPIDCTLDGDDFSCETQSVSPVAYSLGAVGWEYAVVFEGQALDDGRLSGVASVSFPSIDGETWRTLEYYDIDPSDCAQDWNLELVAAD